MVGLQYSKKYGMDLGRWEKRVVKITLVMPNGISARYQGKAYDSTCVEWTCLYVNLGGTAEVFNSFCPN